METEFASYSRRRWEVPSVWCPCFLFCPLSSRYDAFQDSEGNMACQRKVTLSDSLTGYCEDVTYCDRVFCFEPGPYFGRLGQRGEGHGGGVRGVGRTHVELSSRHWLRWPFPVSTALAGQSRLMGVPRNSGKEAPGLVSQVIVGRLLH